MQKLRLQYGLRWRTSYPPIPWVPLAWLTVLLGLFALASSLDYNIRRAQMAELAAEVYAAKAQVLSDCEHGAIGYHYQDGRAYECGKPL